MEQFEQYDKGGLLRDRYIKVSDISEGSYGLVSVAKDTKKKDLLVAVKFIYPIDYKKRKEKSTTSTDQKRPSSSPARLKSPQIGSPNKHNQNSIFISLLNEAEKEIKIHKILGQHPHISQLYDNFDSCLILEFCSRGDLYEAIHNGNGPATTQDLKDVFQQILNAIEYCHSKGVYHRDLKPENILIAEDWSIKLCDWGLATTNKFISDKDEFDIGSERYMAPELFDNDIESYDASKIDIWSIGVILLTLVFHKNPFQVANYSDKRFLQFASNREALFDIFSTMSGDLFSVLRFCLTIDPDNRDLKSVSEELNSLRFFTIDEEYEASDYEEEEEEELEEDYDYISYDEVDEKNQSSNLTVPTTESSSIKSSSENNKLENFGSDKSNSPPDSQYQIPHNHRADALLSTNTKAKPIPINTHDFKFIRNTRKPLNVASYNQAAIINRNGYTNNSHNNNKYQNFNREDYFTPKSVFNHYMDKYGEKKRNIGVGGSNVNGNVNGNGIHENGYKKPPLRRKRTWKANQNRYKQNGGGGNHHNHNHRSNGHKNISNHDKFGSGLNGGSTSFKKTSGGLTSNYHPLPHPNSSNINGSINNNGSSNLSNSGKYIPPYLRSPLQQPHQKSPLSEPLIEELDNLSLENVDDEVFHLEDDFENNNELNKISSNLRNENVVSDGDNDEFLNNNPNNVGFGGGGNNLNNRNGPKGSIKGFKSSPTQGITKFDNINGNGHTTINSATACDNNGKYVPPFRRASISRTTNINGSHQQNGIISINTMNIGTSLPNGNGSFMKDSAQMQSQQQHSNFPTKNLNKFMNEFTKQVNTNIKQINNDSNELSTKFNDNNNNNNNNNKNQNGTKINSIKNFKNNERNELNNEIPNSFDDLWFSNQKKNWSDYDD
ncbi:KSP2 [Candida pseudojiufengensis]|uniref:KSP2 n=1 Tax=Candida pseudojiufengensis TaxID=497109 RepID=UPI0022248C12|nr:KSP2 [Candida pseudojiufengensis]KAI5960592.1 KSP2 [Candida pseudojiufengensis]